MLFLTNLIVDSRPCGSHWPEFVHAEFSITAPRVALLRSHPVGNSGVKGKNS